MNRTRVKFCGITRAAGAEQAVALGVDALGFVFAPTSPRRVELEQAAAIRRTLPPFVTVVVLVMDQARDEVVAITQALQPDLLQFHGAETEAFCLALGRPYIRAVPMGEGAAALQAIARAHPQARALLLDSHRHGRRGGTGEAFDWAAELAAVPQPLILAGGLHAGNVGAAIRQRRPFAVDVSSGVEQAPGLKDSGKMADFLRAVREADNARH